MPVLATDENVVADEVADQMEETNDEPPYDQDDYPGSDTNSDSPWVQEFGLASSTVPLGVVPGFVAQCGLIKFSNTARDAQGDAGATAPSMNVFLHLVPGSYKGVLAASMGQ